MSKYNDRADKTKIKKIEDLFDDVLGEFKGYRGSRTLKKPGTPINWTPELILEWEKCKNDVVYFGERYMKIITLDDGLQPITLYDYQKEIILSGVNNRRTVAECARQSGKTTAITILILWQILFKKHYKVAILANKSKTAMEILARIKLAYENLPDWLQHGVVEWNKTSIKLENGSEILSSATSGDNIRGFSANFLFIDEVAAIDNWDEFYTSVVPIVTQGKKSKIVLVSTVNGLNHFHKITTLARQKKNGFNIISVTWKSVPGRDEKWRQETLAEMQFDEEKFAQEYENRYLGSSGSLISGSVLQELVAQIPIAQNNNLYQYEKPIEGHTYAMTVDVSRGKGLDYSAFQIIDITKMPYKQVMVFRDNFISPAEFAEVIFRIGKQYFYPACLVEINDIGEQVAEMLYFDYEYEHMLFTESHGRTGKRITTGMRLMTDKGVRTTKTVKNVGCSILKLLVEQKQLILNNEHTIHELATFSLKGQSYEAEEGHHDDLVMCLVLFAWMSEQQYFKHLTDINTLMKLREKDEEDIENEMLPFGFIQDGTDQIEEALELDIERKNTGENWVVVG